LNPAPTETIAHAISLAVAPAFLLSALGLLINLFATRLARVVDRARWVEQAFATLPRSLSVPELRLLDRRMRIINAAIALATGSAIAVCLLVGALFVAGLIGTGFGRTVAGLFILAMVLLVGALTLFLIEIRLASRAIRIRNELLERE
jgi:hypothetical protein